MAGGERLGSASGSSPEVGRNESGLGQGGSGGPVKDTTDAKAGNATGHAEPGTSTPAGDRARVRRGSDAGPVRPSGLSAAESKIDGPGGVQGLLRRYGMVGGAGETSDDARGPLPSRPRMEDIVLLVEEAAGAGYLRHTRLSDRPGPSSDNSVATGSAGDQNLTDLPSGTSVDNPGDEV